MSIDEAFGGIVASARNAGLNAAQAAALAHAIEVYVNASIAFHVAHMTTATQDPPASTEGDANAA
jgi:hypothetical protein